jgi:hypothetical protein
MGKVQVQNSTRVQGEGYETLPAGKGKDMEFYP